MALAYNRAVAGLLAVNGLTLELPGRGGPLRPVDGVNFDLAPGECVGLVGESGCGKSLTALTLLGLTRELPGARVTGQAQWTGADGVARDLLELGEGQLQRVRGGEIGLVFQDPLSALNPLLRLDFQIAEALARHHGLRGPAAIARVIELLAAVGVPQPEQRARQYPHQLSGGLRQRALLALGLAGEPRLLIADEPTTALDVTIQAQILLELKRLQRERGLAVLLITHDLGVVAQLCQRVLVMYAGRIVEQAPASAFFAQPRHPYSCGLLASLPAIAGGQDSLASISGSPPQPGAFPAGCRFHPRCPYATGRCREAYPVWHGAPEHGAACWEVSG
jgi:oligopeptide/dipeptide ABC transporter ATP-binding protein